MSRDIKFRAWVTSGLGLVEEYFMSYNITDINFAQGSPKDSNIRQGNPVKLRINNDPTKTFGMHLDSKEPVVLMQYTGLTDKNGVEIYEGDLFNCIYHSDGHTDHTYSVEYWKDSTKFLLRRHGNLCPQNGVVQSVSDVARYEVIGNIYENKELLK